MNEIKINTLLIKAHETGASDIHLTVGEQPAFRIDGEIIKTMFPQLSEEDMLGAITETAPEEIRKNISSLTDEDYPYEIKGISRFRINLAKASGKFSMTIRLISYDIPDFKTLNMPQSLENFAKLDNGIVLVTGVAGSGKSTTIASILEYINNTRRKHIITVEDPIEYVYKSKKSIFTQRQVKTDTENFLSGMKYALRQDPDVILIGEIRDAETVKSALYAAETGHLVFATLHTFNALQTINRVLSFFEPTERETVRAQFAQVYRGSISQKLLPLAREKGRIPAHEILFTTPTVKDFIIKNEPDEIYKLVQKGSYDDMITFNNSLYKLFKEGKITQETAIDASDNPNELNRLIRGVY